MPERRGVAPPDLVVVHRTPGWLWAIALAATGLYLALLSRVCFPHRGHLGFTLFDDAMISMRYAHNFARGLGLCWNPGEPPVEGYSNLLWTLWMALLHLLPVPARLLSLAVSLSSFGLLIGNLWLVQALVRRAGGHTTAAVVAVLLSALKYSQVLWSLQGMEVALAALLLDAGLLLTWRLLESPTRPDAVGLACVLVALVLTRDELLIPTALLLGVLLLDASTRGQARWVALAVAAAVVGHFVFRLTYYGDLLPNTYYLKLTGVRLDVRWLRGLASTLRLGVTDLLVPAILLGFAPRAEGGDRWRRRLLLVVVGAQLAYSTWVGGDAWETNAFANRFLAVCQPVLAILVGLGVEGFAKARHPWACAAALGLAISTRVYVLAAGDVLPGGWSLPHLPPPQLPDQLMPGLGLLALVAAARWVSRSQRAHLATAALTVALLVGDTAAEWAGYWQDGTLSFEREDSSAMLGLRLGELLPSTTKIAVTWAGTIPYFSDLPAVDLLGKNDHHIARLAGRGDFLPGHNKWDYAYSLSTAAPDLIIQLWIQTPEDAATIRRLGYTELPNGLYAHESLRVSRDAVGHLRLSGQN